MLRKAYAENRRQEYLVGGGLAPNGGKRELNRRYLQCFINQVMPASERINVSSLDADAAETPEILTWAWFKRVYGTVSDTLQSTVEAHPEAKRLRTPINVMLREFNYRYDIELESRKLNALMRSDEYKEMQTFLELMGITNKSARWLCDKMQTVSINPDLVAKWRGSFRMTEPDPQKGEDKFEFSISSSGEITGKLAKCKKADEIECLVSGNEQDGNVKISVILKMRGMDTELVNIDFSGKLDDTGNLRGEFQGQHFMSKDQLVKGVWQAKAD